MRRPITTPRTLLAASLMIAATACDRGRSTQSAGASDQPALSTQGAVTGDYSHMAQVYQHIADRYGTMGPTMHQDARWMDQMHAQMAHLGQPGMTGGRGGMMGGPSGMMGSSSMGSSSMGNSSIGWNWMNGIDRWNDQMAQLNDQWATRAQRAGHDDVAHLHREAAELHRQAAQEIVANRGRTEPPGSEAGGAQLAGADVYAGSCAACHGIEGQGVPGAFPPLAGNALLDGPSDRIIDIVRRGLTGSIEVNGDQYNGAMPSFDGRFSPAQLAAILTYVRGTWGNHGSAVTAAEVKGAGS